MELDHLPKVRYATFESWSNLGYKIKKGSKAFWLEGLSYFNEFQVEKFGPPKTEVQKLKERVSNDNFLNEDDIPF